MSEPIVSSGEIAVVITADSEVQLSIRGGFAERGPKQQLVDFGRAVADGNQSGLGCIHRRQPRRRRGPDRSERECCRGRTKSPIGPGSTARTAEVDCYSLR